MNKEDLTNKLGEFKISQEYEKCLQALKSREKFLERFPFRQQPELIDELTPEMLYNPHSGDTDYFFNWIEHSLMWLGAVKLRSSNPWEEASNNLSLFKDLFKITVDDKISIADKIDTHWEDIKGFGGDRHIVKKIISVYYPEKIIPIFKTDDWELFFELLDIDYTERFIDKFKKNYGGSGATVGEKFETLNELFMELKNAQPLFAEMDNAMFMNYIYVFFRDQRNVAKNNEKL